VDGVVGGVDVEHDVLGRRGVGLEEQGDEEPLDLVGVAGDLLVTALGVGADFGQFEAVECALAGQRLAPVEGRCRAVPSGSGLPTTAARRGSRRRSSWSLRSS
jgi:hypothetical protein